jgi:dihydroorotase-like cyclic amidohydrolase
MGRTRASVSMKISAMKKHGQLSRPPMTEAERIERMMYLATKVA